MHRCHQAIRTLGHDAASQLNTTCSLVNYKLKSGLFKNNIGGVLTPHSVVIGTVGQESFLAHHAALRVEKCQHPQVQTTSSIFSISKVQIPETRADNYAFRQYILHQKFVVLILYCESDLD